jgi:hypothetical protein
MSADTYIPRCGDHVRHRPSGEEWVVAFAEPDRNEIAWAGWPDGRADLSDCDVIKVATEEEHRRAVQSWQNVCGDTRRGHVLRLYSTEAERTDGR